MKNIFFLIFVFGLVNCIPKTTTVEKVTTIVLPKDFYGHVVLMISNLDCKPNSYIEVDSNGVGYVCNTDLYYEGDYGGKLKKIIIFQDGIDITEECGNISEGFTMNNSKKYNFFHFEKFGKEIKDNDRFFLLDFIDDLDSKNKIKWGKLE